MISFPQYGIFPRWPESGQGWIHPDDVALVTRLIPSERVLRRDSFDGTYYHYRYGDCRFRLRPCLWLAVQSEGLDIGDPVETVGPSLERELFVGEISGVYYVRRKGRMLYRLRRAGRMVNKLYLKEHLRLLCDKDRIRRSDYQHPTPGWNGAGAAIPLEEPSSVADRQRLDD